MVTSSEERVVACPACKANLEFEHDHIGPRVCEECDAQVWLFDDVAPVSVLNDTEAVPPACWRRTEVDREVVGCSAGGVLGVLAMIFALAWTGIWVGLVVWTLVQYFSNKGTPDPLTRLLWRLVLLSPFLGFSAVFILLSLSVLIGWVEVRVGLDRAEVVRGYRPFLRCRTFIPETVEYVAVRQTPRTSKAENSYEIELGLDRPFRFGSTLPHERRQWLAEATTDLVFRVRK